MRSFRIVTLTAAILMGLAGAAQSDEPMTLEAFTKSVDRTPVKVTGHIGYNDGDFNFYDKNGDGFGVSLDAGRDAREAIEEQCKSGMILIRKSDLCAIEAVGTVEIRGARVFISIDKVQSLTPPQK